MTLPENEDAKAARETSAVCSSVGLGANGAKRALSRALCACAVWVGTACSLAIEEQGSGSSEPVGDVAQAIWEAACDVTAADYHDDDNLAHHTTSSYDHAGCNKTWIAQVRRLGDESILVKDVGPRPTTRSACENVWMSVQVAEALILCPPAPRSCWRNITEDRDPQYTKRGVWNAGYCELPEFYLSEYWGEFPNPSAYSYRVYATARSSRDGATRPMLFEIPTT